MAATPTPSSRKRKPKVKIEFIAGKGSPFTDDEVNESIGPALERHIAKYGTIDKHILLEEVEADPEHPLRRHIEWNDAKAAKRYRLIQISKIIRFVRFQVEVGGKVITPRVFENVVIKDELPSVAPGRAYVHTSTVMKHSTLSNQILERAAKELRQWKERYDIHARYVGEFKYIFDAIDEWEKKTFGKKN